MYNFKSDEARELAELLYQMLLENGEIDLNGIEESKIFDSNSTYGLRRVGAGAIQILNEKEDVERLKDESGYWSYKYILIEKNN